MISKLFTDMDRLFVTLIVSIVAILLRHFYQIYVTPGPDAILQLNDDEILVCI